MNSALMCCVCAHYELPVLPFSLSPTVIKVLLWTITISFLYMKWEGENWSNANSVLIDKIRIEMQSLKESKEPEYSKKPVTYIWNDILMYIWVPLTTQRGAPPLQDNAGHSALTGVGLKCVTQTVIGVAPTGAEVIDASSIPGLGGYHAVTRLENWGLEDLTASVGRLFGLETCIFTGVHILTRSTRGQSVTTFGDLKHQPFSQTIIISLNLNVNTIKKIWIAFQLLPKSDSERLIFPLGIWRSSW